MQPIMVVYLCGTEHLPDTFDKAQAVTDLGLDPERTVFTASAEELPGFEETVQKLLTAGAGEVIGLHATLNEEGRVQPFGEPARFVQPPQMES